MSDGWTEDDLEPPLAGTIKNGPDPISLAGAITAIATVRRQDGTTFSRAVVPVDDQVANKGKWTLPLVVGDLSVPGKKYKIVVVVAWAAGRPQTFGPLEFPVKAKLIPDAPIV